MTIIVNIVTIWVALAITVICFRQQRRLHAAGPQYS